MDPDQELQFDDYLAIANRRKWRLIIPAIVAPLLVYCISLLVPNLYTSESLVIVEQQRIPESFVRPLVTEDINERLASMEEQILSRSRLQSIIDKLDLLRDEPKNVDIDKVLANMRKNIVITPVRSNMGGHGDTAPGFTVSYTSHNPRIAQQVCRETLSLFMAENLTSREQRAKGTTEFLQSQLNDAKRSLDEQDAKLADFKTAHMGRLPGQEDSNLSMLSGLNTQLQVSTQSLHRAQQDKIYTESLLNQQLAAWETSRNSSSPQTLDAQLIELQSKLNELETRYTDDHPDVIRTKSDIEQLKLKAEHNQATQAPTKSGAPGRSPSAAEPEQIKQLRAQLHQYDLAITEYSAEQRRLQEQIGMYQGRLQLSPAVEQEFKKLTRDYQSALDFYNDLLKKKTQSEMASELERRQEGERFRVVDPPTLPEKPSFPNRLRFTMIGAAFGMALGLGLVMLAEHRDRSLRDESSVENSLGLPVLAAVPRITKPVPNKTQMQPANHTAAR